MTLKHTMTIVLFATACAGSGHPSAPSPNATSSGSAKEPEAATASHPSASAAAPNTGAAALPSSPPLPIDQPQTFREGVEAVRSAVAELRENRWSGERAKAADALLLMAATLSRAEPDSNSSAPADVRQNGLLLKNARSAFDAAAYVKQGLKSALTALDELTAACRLAEGDVQPWRRAASKAIDSLDGETFLSFQRPTVQDAFRTTADVLTVIAKKGAGPCRATRGEHAGG